MSRVDVGELCDFGGVGVGVVGVECVDDAVDEDETMTRCFYKSGLMGNGIQPSSPQSRFRAVSLVPAYCILTHEYM